MKYFPFSRTEVRGSTKHVQEEDFETAMEEYDKLISDNSHSFKFIEVPIILKVIKHSRGQCFYLNPKDKLATVEPTFQGSSS